VPANLADSDARFWRARGWCEDSTGELESAERSFRQAFELDRYWWQIHFQLHDLSRRLGRREESARFFKIYQVSKSLSTTIMTLEQSVEGLNHQEFCRSMLELAELIEDDEVVTALRGRLSTL